MTTLIALATVVLLVIKSSPPVSPADAVRVLQASHSLANRTGRFVCTDCSGPAVVYIPSSATGGPFGEFQPFAPSTRLDGSPYTVPPWSMSTYYGPTIGVVPLSPAYGQPYFPPAIFPTTDPRWPWPEPTMMPSGGRR